MSGKIFEIVILENNSEHVRVGSNTAERFIKRYTDLGTKSPHVFTPEGRESLKWLVIGFAGESVADAIKSCIKMAKGYGCTHIDVPACSEDVLSEVYTALSDSVYVFDRFLSEKKAELTFSINTESKKLLEKERVIASSVRKVKDWVNMPGTNLNPNRFMQEISAYLAGLPGITVNETSGEHLLKRGLQGLYYVGRGSRFSPTLVEIEYDPKKVGIEAQGESLALVGKGLTFDTGGYNLKTYEGMWEMRLDMAGAAVVAATMNALSVLGCKRKVTGYLCIAENAIGNEAMLPGDVITGKNGKTVTVINTDAEGRLVLMDGLAEAEGHDIIVDVATLTGAVSRAIGDDMAGLFTRDDKLAKFFLERKELFWRLPLHDGYKKLIKGTFTDLVNSNRSGPGATTAALFLEEFVPNGTKSWAHLDIAGAAWSTSATGFGVRSLVDLALKFGRE